MSPKLTMALSGKEVVWQSGAKRGSFDKVIWRELLFPTTTCGWEVDRTCSVQDRSVKVVNAPAVKFGHLTDETLPLSVVGCM